jgi:hypothetical protein
MRDPERPYNSSPEVLFTSQGCVVIRTDEGKIEIHDRRIYFDPRGKDSYIDSAESRDEAWKKIDNLRQF